MTRRCLHQRTQTSAHHSSIHAAAWSPIVVNIHAVYIGPSSTLLITARCSVQVRPSPFNHAQHTAPSAMALAAAIASQACSHGTLPCCFADAPPDPSCPPDQSDQSNSTQPPPVSNQHTAKWRIYTDMGRELIVQVCVGRRNHIHNTQLCTLSPHAISPSCPHPQRRHEDAEPYFRMAMDSAVQGFGPRDGHVASSANNLAELYRLLGRMDDAEPLYRKVNINCGYWLCSC